MKPRRLLVLVGILIVIVVASSACADVTTSALDVNGEDFSKGEVNDFLEAVQDELDASPDTFPELQTTGGTITADASSQVLSMFIQNEILRQHLVATGTDVTEDEVASTLTAQPPIGLPSVELIGAELSARLAATDPTEVEALILGAMVELDPRYGWWFQGQVTPNYVPRPADAPDGDS